MTRLAPSLVLSAAAHGALAGALWLQLAAAPRTSVTLLELVGPEGSAPAGPSPLALAASTVPPTPRVVPRAPAARPGPAVRSAPSGPAPGPGSEAPTLPSPPPAAEPAPEAASGPPSPTAAGLGSGEGSGPAGGLVPPRLAASELPRYPESARRAGIQGTTLLRVRVGTDGSVGAVLVERSSGHPDLDEAAREAVATWRFEPARRRGVPVELWILLPIRFTLG